MSLDGDWRTHTWQLARAMTFFCMVRGHTRDWATINELALEAAKDNPAALAITTKNYAMVFWQTAGVAKHISRMSLRASNSKVRPARITNTAPSSPAR